MEVKNGIFMGFVNVFNFDLSGNEIKEIERIVFYDLEFVLKVDILENNLICILNFRMFRMV